LIAVEMARRTKTDAADLTLSIDGRGKHDILLDDQRTNVKAMSWNGPYHPRNVSKPNSKSIDGSAVTTNFCAIVSRIMPNSSH
jgi:hypothetical protein